MPQQPTRSQLLILHLHEDQRWAQRLEDELIKYPDIGHDQVAHVELPPSDALDGSLEALPGAIDSSSVIVVIVTSALVQWMQVEAARAAQLRLVELARARRVPLPWIAIDAVPDGFLGDLQALHVAPPLRGLPEMELEDAIEAAAERLIGLWQLRTQGVGNEIRRGQLSFQRLEEAQQAGSNQTTFDLSRLGAAELPDAVGEMKWLTHLFVYRGKLTRLPKSVWQLRELVELSFARNQLTNLPAGIGELRKLQRLYLNHNQLTALPPTLGQLSSLEVLFLHRNRLGSLLDESFAHLQALSWLTLDANQFADFPAALCQLPTLKVLSLNHNQIRFLPSAINGLRSLEKLYLRNNQLTFLPPELAELPALKHLDVEDNPLVDPPPEIVAQGTSAILAHLRRRSHQKFDPLTLAFRLVIAHQAPVELLQTFHADGIWQAALRVENGPRTPDLLARVQERLTSDQAGIEPNPLWVAWARTAHRQTLDSFIQQPA